MQSFWRYSGHESFKGYLFENKNKLDRNKFYKIITNKSVITIFNKLTEHEHQN
jgi:hypothetical protein